MTNYENLKQMTSDELAVAICNMISACDRCPARGLCIAGCSHANGLKAWMEMGVLMDMEVEE